MKLDIQQFGGRGASSGSQVKTEYHLLSSFSGGLNETYKTLKEAKARYNYIKKNQDKFSKNSMIYFYKNVYNEEGKITANSTLGLIDFNEKKKK